MMRKILKTQFRYQRGRLIRPQWMDRNGKRFLDKRNKDKIDTPFVYASSLVVAAEACTDVDESTI